MQFRRRRSLRSAEASEGTETPARLQVGSAASLALSAGALVVSGAALAAVPAVRDCSLRGMVPLRWQLECLRSRKAGEELDVLAERLSSLPGAWRALVLSSRSPMEKGREAEWHKGGRPGCAPARLPPDVGGGDWEVGAYSAGPASGSLGTRLHQSTILLSRAIPTASPTPFAALRASHLPPPPHTSRSRLPPSPLRRGIHQRRRFPSARSQPALLFSPAGGGQPAGCDGAARRRRVQL